MEYQEFLARIINDGIEAARADYGPGPRADGAVAGFEVCRGLGPGELRLLLAEVNRFQWVAQEEEPDRIAWRQCYRAEVEWVCNCVSSLMAQNGLDPLASYLPTARAVMKVAEVVGVAEVTRVG